MFLCLDYFTAPSKSNLKKLTAFDLSSRLFLRFSGTPCTLDMLNSSDCHSVKIMSNFIESISLENIGIIKAYKIEFEIYLVIHCSSKKSSSPHSTESFPSIFKKFELTSDIKDSAYLQVKLA